MLQAQIIIEPGIQIMPVEKKFKLKINNHISDSIYSEEKALKIFKHLQMFENTKIELVAI